MKCCERELNKTRFFVGHAFHYGSQVDAPLGYVWKCPKCGQRWQHSIEPDFYRVEEDLCWVPYDGPDSGEPKIA